MPPHLHPINDLASLRAQRRAYFKPVFVGVGATLAASSVFTSALITGSTLGLGWTAASDDMLRPCVTLFSALAALTELAACVAIVHDRAHARDKFFSRIAWFGMLFGAIAFLAAVLQWRAALAAAQPISGGGVILLGYGAWAAILAFLAGSPTDFIMLQDGEQWTFATVAEAIDEKTPLKALV